MHRWDAGAAFGVDEPIDTALAADGVAEFVDDVLPGMSNDLDGPLQTIALRARDIDTRWTVCAGGGTCRAVATGASAEVIVSATASDLVLLLWGRRQIAQLDIEGDVEALKRFLARATF